MMDLFSSEQRVSSAPVVINAHRNELVCLATNQGGSMVSCDWWRAVLTSDWWRAVLTTDWLQVATASTKGTLIRIWDTAKRVQLVELRRGADQVTHLDMFGNVVKVISTTFRFYKVSSCLNLKLECQIFTSGWLLLILGPSSK